MAGELPAGFGGLMRYKEEYKSKFSFSPAQVVGFIMVIIVMAMLLRIFFPAA
jgi:preprotein translocase subunit Sec61beta